MTDDSIREEIHQHYAGEIDEDTRIRGGLNQLELLRTQEIVRRFLSEGPHRVLDVGGATGVHAEWLLEDGHTVHLVDPVASQVELAQRRFDRQPRFSAAVGDARSIDAPDASFDAVLLFGPLYHLIDRADRIIAWREAHRVVRPGGVVFGAAISRFASLFDGLSTGRIFEPAFREMVDQDLVDGQHRNPSRRPGWFTTSYFHKSEELIAETEEAGLDAAGVFGVEGLAIYLPQLAPHWEDPDQRETILDAARAVESEPTLLGLSAHLVAVARRQDV